MCRRAAAACLTALLLVAGCGRTPPPGPPAATAAPALFADVTAASGVVATYGNGEEIDPPHLGILESLGGGVAALDYDGDGKLDLYFPGGGRFAGPGNRDIVGRPGKLYRNLGGLTFADVTEAAGLATLADGAGWFYSHAAAVGDYDRDGFPDLLVTGYGRVALFHNEPAPGGGRRFVDVTEPAGLGGKSVRWATSAAWADLDGDGWPDLYLCQYVDWGWDKHPTCFYDGKTPDVCPPKKFDGLPALLFHNRQNGTFAEVGAAAGLNRGPDGADQIAQAKGLGVVVADLDRDGKPEVYQANDTTPNFLYRNRSTPGTPRLAETGFQAGVAVDGGGMPNGSMGVDAGDPDGTGRPSLWVTNYENELHALYKNLSHDNVVAFQFCTPASGIAAIGQKFVGWGTAFADFDRDGWEDLFVANGHAIRYPTGATRRQRPVLLRNFGDGKFKDVSLTRGGDYFSQQRLSRGAVAVDLDNDGKVDVVIAHMNEPATVLRNVSPDGPHWLGVRLVGAKGADVVGARVSLTAGGRTQTRFAKGGGSYASTPDRRFVFGLAAADKIETLAVVWPDGKRQEWAGPGVDKYLTLTQGEPAAK